MRPTRIRTVSAPVRRGAVWSAVALLAALAAAGCSSSGPGKPPWPSVGPARAPQSSLPAGSPVAPAAPPPAKGSVRVEGTVATGLDTPWGLAVLPDGNLLVSSRDSGAIWHVDARSGKKTEAGRVPGVAAAGEGGLLGIALSPSYADDHLVYAYFTTASDNRIARMTYTPSMPAGEQLGAPDTIVRDIPKGELHNGGRIAFGPDGMLYAGTGETGDRPLAQDPKSLGGKILRMTPDGAPAPGNPTPGSLVYSPGHRNVQGLAWDPARRLWASEFGQDTWDELNWIQAGRNYGWPIVEGKAGRSGYVDPVTQWHPAEDSPSGIAYDKGSIWMAALRGERLWRIPLDGTRVAAAPQAFLVGRYGRLRSLAVEPDGSLLVTTSNTDGRGDPRAGDDRILRLAVT
jgi:glucose/arabinose dehydrogenase